MYPVYLIFLKHLSRWNPQILKSDWLAFYNTDHGLEFPCQYHVVSLFLLCCLLFFCFHSSHIPFPFSFSDFSSLSSHINWIESKVYKFVFLQWFIRHVPPHSDTCRPFNTTGNFKSWIVFFLWRLFLGDTLLSKLINWIFQVH